MNDAVTEATEEAPQTETPEVEVKAEETPSRDELLKEFDEGMTPDEPPAEPEMPIGDARVDETFQFMQQERARRAQDDVSKAVQTIKSFDETLGQYDDDMLEGWLDKQARKDPRLTSAWNKRYDQPEKWNQILNTLARDLAGKTVTKDESTISQDMQSVRNAINTSETKSEGPTSEEIARMSDDDFAKYKESLGLRTSDW